MITEIQTNNKYFVSISMSQILFWLVGLITKSSVTLATPWTVAGQAPLSMGFSRQEYWSGLPFPSPRDM